MPSTVIDHFSYDEINATLKITFRSGNIYVYKDVSQKVYNNLRIAGSKGRYFNHYIKNNYTFEHLV